MENTPRNNIARKKLHPIVTAAEVPSQEIVTIKEAALRYLYERWRSAARAYLAVIRP